MKVSLVFSLIADLCMALGEHPLLQYADCWEHQVDDQWRVAVNGHGEARTAGNPPQEVPAHCAYVEFNGWPAGVIHVNAESGGWIAAGSAANEDELIAALDRAIEGCPRGS